MAVCGRCGLSFWAGRRGRVAKNCPGCTPGHPLRRRRHFKADDLRAEWARTRDPRPCAAPGCDREEAPKRAGLCEGHYSRRKQGLPLTPLRRRRNQRIPDVDGIPRQKFIRAAQHGLTAEAFMEMLERQHRSCAVCGAEFEGWDIEVDHDHACCPGRHACGECVRGLLCGACNRMLGAAGDDRARLLAGARYLLR